MSVLTAAERVMVEESLDREVFQLFLDGKLHGFDCLWIMGLQHDAQMNAAMKCVRGDLRQTYDDRRKHKGHGTFYL